jgi:hypothetical protein
VELGAEPNWQAQDVITTKLGVRSVTSEPVAAADTPITLSDNAAVLQQQFQQLSESTKRIQKERDSEKQKL